MARAPRSRSKKPARPVKIVQGMAGVDPWADLRQLTAARIGLARSGASLATGPLLDLRLAHARARDAVHAPLDEERLVAELGDLGLPVLRVASAAKERAQYLLRPDLGRQFASADLSSLRAQAPAQSDLVFVITEGLSARAMVHAKPLLAEVIPVLADEGWKIAPLVVARLGRVAIGDAIAVAMKADICAILIGERPGLSAPDSMGAYLTWQPTLDTTDAQRNCISNIRPDGIAYADAAFKLSHILRAMRAQQISGVALKDTTDRLAITEKSLFPDN
jgi:ethanolamine ammonia-lyase small subunit